MGENLVVVGRVAGPYGVKGWFRVTSFTEPRDNILSYRPWHIEQDGTIKLAGLLSGRQQGKSLIAQIEGVADRDAAARLAGASILVERANFAAPDEQEYYWRDLVGLTVRTAEGNLLGTVDSLMETGANDVLVVQGDRRRLIPFIMGDVVKSVDLSAGTIVVVWDLDF